MDIEIRDGTEIHIARAELTEENTKSFRVKFLFRGYILLFPDPTLCVLIGLVVKELYAS